MKNILITGTNSYLGNSVEAWLLRYKDNYSITTLCVREKSWEKESFSKYDVVFHVAGISYVSEESRQMELYEEVNTKLTIDLAQKAKNDGVRQFIFISSMSIYSGNNLVDNIIYPNTVPYPNEIYGESKWNAEQGLNNLVDESFRLAILRPPMIYGKNSKGNYPKLVKLVKLMPVFPDFPNQRSMLHIDNLCEFVKQIIDGEKDGVFFPQNAEYISTSDLVQEIAQIHGKKIMLTKIFNPLIRLFINFNVVKKLFGNLVYDKSMSQYDFLYQVRDFKQSIKLTENKD